MQYKEIAPLLRQGEAARKKDWKNKKRIRIFYTTADQTEKVYVFKDSVGWEEYSLTPADLRSKSWEIINYQKW